MCVEDESVSLNRYFLWRKKSRTNFESPLCTPCGRFLNSVKFWDQPENSVFKKIRNSRREVSLVIHPDGEHVLGPEP